MSSPIFNKLKTRNFDSLVLRYKLMCSYGLLQSMCIVFHMQFCFGEKKNILITFSKKEVLGPLLS